MVVNSVSSDSTNLNNAVLSIETESMQLEGKDSHCCKYIFEKNNLIRIPYTLAVSRDWLVSRSTQQPESHHKSLHSSNMNFQVLQFEVSVYLHMQIAVIVWNLLNSRAVDSLSYKF